MPYIVRKSVGSRRRGRLGDTCIIDSATGGRVCFSPNAGSNAVAAVAAAAVDPRVRGGRGDSVNPATGNPIVTTIDPNTGRAINSDSVTRAIIPDSPLRWPADIAAANAGAGTTPATAGSFLDSLNLNGSTWITGIPNWGVIAAGVGALLYFRKNGRPGRY